MIIDLLLHARTYIQLFFVLRFLLARRALCAGSVGDCFFVFVYYFVVYSFFRGINEQRKILSSPQRYDFFLKHANKMRIFCKNDRFYLSHTTSDHQKDVGQRVQSVRCKGEEDTALQDASLRLQDGFAYRTPFGLWVIGEIRPPSSDGENTTWCQQVYTLKY